MKVTKSHTQTHTEIDLNSSLNCLRRNTVILDRKLGHFEHIAMWVPEKLKSTTESLSSEPRGGRHGGDVVLGHSC